MRVGTERKGFIHTEMWRKITNIKKSRVMWKCVKEKYDSMCAKRSKLKWFYILTHIRKQPRGDSMDCYT